MSMRWNASVGFDVLSNALERQGFVFIYDRLDRDKALGTAPDTLKDLLDRVSSDVMLIEADGSRRLPFKAPYPHEPVIPPETTRVILVVGINTLGKPLDRDHVYNADAIIGQFGYPEAHRCSGPGWPVSCATSSLACRASERISQSTC
jgi:hypothetical protein